MPAHAKTVLITGAAGGIGAAATRRLAQLGFTVYAGVRSPAPHLEASEGVRTLRLDVTDADDVRQAAALVTAEAGALHALVNNAGIIVQGPLELVPSSELRRQFDVNVFGPAQVTAAFLPLLRAGRGRLVNISAPTARAAVPFMGPISAGKAALESLTDALRGELAAWRIPISVIQPSGTDTAIFATAEKSAAESLRTVPPELLDLYAPALASLTTAAAKMKLSPTDAVVEAIVHAVQSRKPKPRYTVGRDAKAAALLAKLPIGLRTSLVLRALGIKSA
jgi:NAD(P)-dependent dehydrogenase (short-subunit alcohol dehydrogenase family)